HINEIPNAIILQETGSVGLMVTAAFDIHKSWIAVEIKLWTAGGRSYSLDWRRLEGETDNLQSESWNAVRDIVENETWKADDGKIYPVAFSLIDAGYRTHNVYNFVSKYPVTPPAVMGKVSAIMGRETPPKTAEMPQFSDYQSKKYGITAYNVNSTIYKDRLAVNLRRDWNTGDLQPLGYCNFPSEYGDDFFRQYEAEEKKEKKYTSNSKTRFVWSPKPNSENHAWDCGYYNLVAVDMICYEINKYYLDTERIDYSAFWAYIAENKLFYQDAEGENACRRERFCSRMSL
ncbi:MAG: hypothetical protein GY854_16510, partial [Deltaproteobacteria bacterium]|nr:hypothetical protein [Deltaproteobacteria bacterium]